jgi:serine carboxypeptidase-like clade I
MLLRVAAAAVLGASLLAFSASGVRAARPADLVTSLPGWSGPLPSAQYSGFLEVDKTNGRNLHYWFVEAQTADPSTAPVVLWMNGGPGCSSLDGYLYEHGPLHFGPGLTLVENQWTWARVANVIYLEAPAGVGFSFSKTTSDYNTNDNKTAADNHKALQLFFQAFPEFAKQDFYIAGESYAGIYVPTLARLVNLDSTIPQFKGILVGNGVTDNHFGSMMSSFLPFVHQHALISDETWNAIETHCPTAPSSPACKAAEQIVMMNFQDINVYDVYLDCYSQRPAPAGFPAPSEMVPCIDSTKGTDWLNQAEVKKALHVTQSPLKWTICSNVLNYTSQWSTVIPIYHELLKSGKRVLVYSGDVDGAVPYVGTEKWTSAQKWNRTHLWKHWFVEKSDGRQVAGYSTSYKEGLDFVTVKGSGHMVPQFKPEAAFAMFSRWIAGKPL